MRTDLRGLTPRQLESFCTTELGQRPGQGLRLATLLFRERVRDVDTMSRLNRGFRERLKANSFLSSLVAECLATSDDGTQKLLYRLDDGKSIEGVLIPGADRLTLCVSTQAGCAQACAFCLTGRGGFDRNLAPAEIVNQVLAAEMLTSGRRITNIVLMGTGEPLSNYEAVRAFAEIATDHHGMAFPPRKVTLSTCGLAPMIERMADDRMDISLAISLNATTDAVRDSIMPANLTFPLPRLMQSLRYYTEKTGRTVAIEYVLFEDVNDSTDDARRLVTLTDGLPCMINLLPFNPFPGSVFQPPRPDRLSVFRDILVRASRIAVVRKSRGKDILAACGQLRADAGEGTLTTKRVGN